MASELEIQGLAAVALLSAAIAFFIALRFVQFTRQSKQTIHRLQNELAARDRRGEACADQDEDRLGLDPRKVFPGLIFFWSERLGSPVVLGRTDAVGIEGIKLGEGGIAFMRLLTSLDEEVRRPLETAVDLVWDTEHPVSGIIPREGQSDLGYSAFFFDDGVYLIIAPATQIGRSISQEGEVLRDLPFPLWKTDRSGNILWVNRAYANAVETSTDSRVLVEQRHLIEDISPFQLAKEPDQSQEEGEGPVRLVRLGHGIINRQRQAFDVTSLWEGDEVIHMAVDRSAYERLARELDVQDTAHKQVLNQLTNAVVVTGRDQNLIYYNDAYARLWELSEAFLDRNPSHAEIMDELRRMRKLPEKADYKGWLNDQLKLYTSPESSGQELWHLPDNKTLRVVSTQHPLGGLLILYEDVTDQLALESSYNTLIGVQRATLDNLYEGVAVFGVDGRLQLYNAAYERMYNLEPGSLKAGELFEDIARKANRDEGLETDWDDLRNYITRTNAENRPKTGRMVRDDDLVVDYAAVPLPDGATLLTHLDVSDTNRMQSALQQRNDALEAADRLKSEFLTHVSYQLRTPLNSVLGFSEMLLQNYFGPLNDKQNEYVEGIMHSSHQLSDLIDNIIDLTAIQEGELVLDVTSVDVAEVIETIVDLHRPRAQEKGLRFFCELEEELGTIEADEARLKQIVANLLSNAFKYTYPGDRVVITARGNEREVMVQVEDNGMGIPREYQNNIFEHFEALDRDARKRGAGLGLSMVRSFVELHGGRIELDSELDKGTRLAFFLPRKVHGELSAATNVIPYRQRS